MARNRVWGDGSGGWQVRVVVFTDTKNERPPMQRLLQSTGVDTAYAVRREFCGISVPHLGSRHRQDSLSATPMLKSLRHVQQPAHSRVITSQVKLKVHVRPPREQVLDNLPSAAAKACSQPSCSRDLLHRHLPPPSVPAARQSLHRKQPSL